MKPASVAVHAGYAKETRLPLSPPIVQTSVYVYQDLEDYDAVARGDTSGHYYARNSNENVAMLADAVADLEGAASGMATSSGMAAVLVAIRAAAPKPCVVVAPLDLYGGTWTLLRSARLGTTMGPFEAWLALRGLRTLEIRVRRMSANAGALAAALREAPGVLAVHYPSLPGSAQEALARKLLPEGAGGMLAFDLDGPRAAVQRMISRFQMVSFAASLGGVETTISHPEVTSHRGLTAQERESLGIKAGTVRVSAGIEEASDIIEDFLQALA